MWVRGLPFLPRYSNRKNTLHSLRWIDIKTKYRNRSGSIWWRPNFDLNLLRHFVSDLNTAWNLKMFVSVQVQFQVGLFDLSLLQLIPKCQSKEKLNMNWPEPENQVQVNLFDLLLVWFILSCLSKDKLNINTDLNLKTTWSTCGYLGQVHVDSIFNPSLNRNTHVELSLTQIDPNRPTAILIIKQKNCRQNESKIVFNFPSLFSHDSTLIILSNCHVNDVKTAYSFYNRLQN